MTDHVKGLRIIVAMALLGATLGAGAALANAARLEASLEAGEAAWMS